MSAFLKDCDGFVRACREYQYAAGQYDTWAGVLGDPGLHESAVQHMKEVGDIEQRLFEGAAQVEAAYKRIPPGFSATESPGVVGDVIRAAAKDVLVWKDTHLKVWIAYNQEQRAELGGNTLVGGQRAQEEQARMLAAVTGAARTCAKTAEVYNPSAQTSAPAHPHLRLP